MRFDFDPAKDEINRIKHGVPLSFGARVFEDGAVAIIPTIRIGDEEERFKAIGLVDGRLWTAIHVWRDDSRPADLGEAKQCERTKRL